MGERRVGAHDGFDGADDLRPVPEGSGLRGGSETARAFDRDRSKGLITQANRKRDGAVSVAGLGMQPGPDRAKVTLERGGNSNFVSRGPGEVTRVLVAFEKCKNRAAGNIDGEGLRGAEIGSARHLGRSRSRGDAHRIPADPDLERGCPARGRCEVAQIWQAR